jgi:DNA-binding CsgD family transcriptional regulator
MAGRAPLLERDRELDRLASWLGEASAGRGRLVLVGGEAGVGKSALVERFAAAAPAPVRRLAGACDPIATARPLGPLTDIAAATGGGLAASVRAGDPPAAVATALLDELGQDRHGSLVIVEDVHFADGSTLDVLRFLARRLRTVRAMLVATYRDDAIGADHPVRMLLGDVAAFPTVRRLTLAPLSPRAVTVLAAGTGLDAAELHHRTGGNPFFVTEIVAAGVLCIPPTARDAVLARAARLSPAARVLIDALAVLGDGAEAATIAAVAGADPAALDECVAAGTLRQAGGLFGFRHEIARLAVYEAILPMRRVALHRGALHALAPSAPPASAPPASAPPASAPPVSVPAAPSPSASASPAARPRDDADPARLAHHAEAAGDADAALRYAIAAATRAARLGAHALAAAQYARALRVGSGLDPHRRADLLEHRSRECAVSDQVPEAVAACEEALAGWRAMGDRRREGDALHRLSRLQWMSHRGAESHRTALAAVALLEQIPPGAELARAYANVAQQSVIVLDLPAAVTAGERATALARDTDDPATVAHATMTVGQARLLAGDDAGEGMIRDGVRRARAIGDDELAARGLYGLLRAFLFDKRLARAEAVVADGVSWCSDRGIEFWRYYLLGGRAVCRLDEGDWAAAEELANLVLANTHTTAIARRISPCLTLASLRVRRGEPGAGPLLAEAQRLSDLIGWAGSGQSVTAVRLEEAYLSGGEGDPDAARVLADLVAADRHTDRWQLGEIAYWRWKAGRIDTPPARAARPYALQIAGRWAEAAAAWTALGCPYHAAWALADGADEAALRRALAAFERLGAHPAARHVAARLKAMGAQRVPRRPRASTRANPALLTDRELEVLALVAAGLADKQIAGRLVISRHTVHHHVSAILRKLGTASRSGAASEATRLGLIAEHGQSSAVT